MNALLLPDSDVQTLQGLALRNLGFYGCGFFLLEGRLKTGSRKIVLQYIILQQLDYFFDLGLVLFFSALIQKQFVQHQNVGFE